MSTSAADGPHEFVVEPEFEVVEGGRPDPTPRRRRLSWLGSVSTREHTPSERAKDDIREGTGQRTYCAGTRTTSDSTRAADSPLCLPSPRLGQR